MGANISSIKKRRMERRIKDTGKMQTVLKAFHGASKSSSSKVFPFNTGSDNTAPLEHVKGIANVICKKYFTVREPSGHSDVEDLRRARKRDQERITSQELLIAASKARNIIYENMLEEDVCLDCYCCHMVTRESTIDCRVCGQVAHRSCLESRGFLESENQQVAALQAEQESPIGWSCPDCEDVSHLLSAEEMQKLMDRFDIYDSNGDDKFNFDDFLQQIPTKTNAESTSDLLKKFSEYDRDRDENVTWETFKLLEALRILRKMSQSYLVKSLKPREIEKIKSCFRNHDTFNTGVVTMQACKRVLQTWSKSVGFTGTGSDPAVWNKDTQFSLISWDRFIREHAFHIICARPNTATIHHYLTLFNFT